MAHNVDIDESAEQEIINLFWDWYMAIICEIYQPADRRSFNDRAQARAMKLGIKLGPVNSIGEYTHE